tara:strand:- start:798 stop:968 length:171 start_codon:yes stop_codon:yes gene_type:complete
LNIEFNIYLDIKKIQLYSLLRILNKLKINKKLDFEFENLLTIILNALVLKELEITI